MAVQKLVLAEGERILSLMFLSPEEIGLVSMVSNLGSLVLRLVFAPIEEIAFTAFAVQRSSEESKKLILKSVVLVETSVGLLSAMFGPPLCEAVLTVLYGTKWVEATYLLQIYSLMILVFALNGCFEAYFFAVADSKRMRYSFIAQWVAFGSLVASVSLFAHWGPIAILIGNTGSMIVRIVWASTSFLKISDPVHPSSLKVYRNIAIGAIVSALAIRTVKDQTVYMQLLVGGSLALVTVLSILSTLRATITDIDSSKRI
jgi:O-antigen/teichoic acid export membrane protein